MARRHGRGRHRARPADRRSASSSLGPGAALSVRRAAPRHRSRARHPRDRLCPGPADVPRRRRSGSGAGRRDRVRQRHRRHVRRAAITAPCAPAPESSALPISGWGPGSRPCSKRMSRRAAGASAASATRRSGTRTRRSSPSPFRPQRYLLGDARIPRGLRAARQKFGLSLDAWLYFPQIVELADLARAFPGTTIVLDHVGAPLGVGVYAGRRQEVFETWRDGHPRHRGMP